MHLLHDPTAATRARVRAEVPDQVDVAIIGAGLGGLTSGALLARQGLKVAVFDGHYVAGGCATMFSRGPAEGRFRFDVGLHYVGDCGPEGRIPRLLKAAGVEGIEFREMDADGIDVIEIPGLSFKIPKDRGLYRDRLVAAFPKEKRGIDRYVRLLTEVDHLGKVLDQRKRGALGILGEALLHGRLLARYQNATIGAFLDTCTKDTDLRAILLGQNGDYGVRPSRASAMIHCGLANHYFKGGFYPVGGGQVLADGLAQVIETHGGSVLLRRPIERIVVEGGRAVGVQVQARRQDPRVVRAGVVISNADIRRTFEELLPAEALDPEAAARARSFEMGGALFITCLGVKGDLREAGLGASNVWGFDGTDFEAFYDGIDRGELEPRCHYVTSGSLKDPDSPGHAPPGHMTLEAMTILPGDPKAWGVDPEKARGMGYRDDRLYLERKQQVEEAMVARVVKRWPWLADKIVLVESASPVTQVRYTGASEGTGYGLAATPEQFMKRRPGYRGPVAGLYLCGASTRAGHGIVGAMASGWNAAFRVSQELDRPISGKY